MKKQMDGPSLSDLDERPVYDEIIFIDFDGTITSEDTLDGAMRLFIPSEEYEVQYRKMKAGKLTLSQALHIAFDGAPAEHLPKMIEYVKTVPVREGFEIFLEAMEQLTIPVVVISGGLKQLIEAVLTPYRERLLDVHYVDLDLSGGTMKLVCPYDDGREVMKKTEIMKLYCYKTAIAIGDGYTDINMSKAADMVFARDLLAETLKKEGVSFFCWNDFYDVTRSIKSSR